MIDNSADIFQVNIFFHLLQSSINSQAQIFSFCDTKQKIHCPQIRFDLEHFSVSVGGRSSSIASDLGSKGPKFEEIDILE